jgi:hypothetical protein
MILSFVNIWWLMGETSAKINVLELGLRLGVTLSRVATFGYLDNDIMYLPSQAFNHL